MEDSSPVDNEEHAEYDLYSKTPPRTKILRKNRGRSQREKQLSSSTSSRIVKANMSFTRRNTVGSFYSDDNDDDDNTELEVSKRTNKRQMKLLRGSERDLKLDIARAQTVAADNFNGHKENEKIPPVTPSYQIETNNRFKSLICRTFRCDKKQKVEGSGIDNKDSSNESYKNNICDDCPPSRVTFYETLKLLIRMGSGEKCFDRHPRRGISKDEAPWQNELNDIIWLELQAYHAQRSPLEEDAYLCSARDMVEPLLNDIKNYTFRRHSKDRKYSSSDSGVEDDCPGCVSLYCTFCMEAQNEALHDVEDLLKRLEEAESLFPSNKAFAELYPLYKSPEIVGRVKAMCLWYNLTKHQRLKINILVRLLTTVMETKGRAAGEDSCSGSPSDSNNSNNSCGIDGPVSDLFNIPPIKDVIDLFGKKTFYRRYIENILKTTALDKSLIFLKKIHQNVLKKTQLTMDKPEDEELFSKISCGTEEEELHRYGMWSPEAQSMALPSYRTMFIFLSMVPLQVVHAYIEMRLEEKPKKPSPLSLRQLLRETREGLLIAVAEKNKTRSYIQSATSGHNVDVANFTEQLEQFDESVRKLFLDYLDYFEKVIFLNKNSVSKNLLQDEYTFCNKIVDDVPNGRHLLSDRIASVVATSLCQIGERLMDRVEDVLKIVSKSEEHNVKQNIFLVCRDLQALFNEERDISWKLLTFYRMNVKSSFVSEEKKENLKSALSTYRTVIPIAIAKVQGIFDHTSITSLDEADKNAVNARIREILMQLYRFGFDFYKDVTKNLPPHIRPRVVSGMVKFAKLWMKFVTERCQRGRGMRPRWASQGMEFLLTVCEPANTQYLSEELFEDLKKDMDVCISHVIGTIAPTTPEGSFHSISPRSSLEHIRARSRGSSPSPRPTYKSQRSGTNRKTSVEQQSPITDTIDASSPTFSKKNIESSRSTPIIKIVLSTKTHQENWQEAMETLESEMNEKLRKSQLIGKVLHDRTLIKNFHRRNVTFSWQRGIKIGQGRFGKVYTAVNNNTGDMMAVKEIALQHNDPSTIKQVSEEMKMLEGIMHPNLLRYYGVEVHKDEMLIFMEYCSEGTLETLVSATENGLPELLVRRFTYQLVSGVKCLHEHSIVHRDIKTANIFLTNEGNCLKIGDFGCAAKIKSNTTMPGELKGFVGTQAYMAPEVFTKNMSEGHGRAADIWSIGCVVVEMASGERPWAQYDSNYQIMFKVGMGQSPDPPDDMIDEGLDFLEMCFKHDPKERASARELFHHDFVLPGREEENSV